MSLPLPLALRVIRTIMTRLEAINTEDGFHTDLGESVIYGRVPLEPNTPMVGVFSVEEKATEERGGNILRCALRIMVEIRIPRLKSDQDDERLELYVADCQKAIELEDRTIGNLSPANLSYVGRGFAHATDTEYRTTSAWLTYAVPYNRLFGDPAARA